MPTLRKIALDQVADWDLDVAPFVLEAMLNPIAANDRVGLTRIDRAGADGGEHAWHARVYHSSSEGILRSLGASPGERRSCHDDQGAPGGLCA